MSNTANTITVFWSNNDGITGTEGWAARWETESGPVTFGVFANGWHGKDIRRDARLRRLAPLARKAYAYHTGTSARSLSVELA